MSTRARDSSHSQSGKKVSKSLITSDTEDDPAESNSQLSSTTNSEEGQMDKMHAYSARIPRSNSFKFGRAKNLRLDPKLVYKFVLAPGESRQLPVLPEFPQGYSFQIKPVNE